MNKSFVSMKSIGACPLPCGDVVPSGHAGWMQLRITPSLIDKQIDFAKSALSPKIDLWIGAFSKGIDEPKIRKIVDLSSGVFFQNYVEEWNFLFKEGTNLESLWVGRDASVPKVDFQLWPNLRSLSLSHDRGENYAALVNIEELILWGNINKAEPSLTLHSYESLRILELVSNNLSSLATLSLPEGLRSLSLYRMPKLCKFDTIRTVCESLEQLTIENCARLTDLSKLGSCVKLKKLMLYGIPPLSDLKFCDNLSELRFFSFMGVDVIDGRISRLQKLPNLRYAAFTSKRHFDMKFGQLGHPEDA